MREDADRRRVLLMVVDGWTPSVLAAGLARRTLPTFARLAAAGILDLQCTSIFPSITPAATASIITGRHPAAHGIAGMSWLNPRDGQVSYFGDDVATVLRRGPADFLRAFLVRLNGDRLRAATLLQTVPAHGRSAASINYLMFKGDVRHHAEVPRVLRLLPRMPRRVEVFGPPVLYLGEFCRPAGARLKHRGMRHRYGLDDAATEEFLLQYGGAGALPDFTVAYFADYDFESHRRGHEDSLDVIQRLDARLARVFDAWGGFDRVLRDVVIVTTADHCHSHVRRDRDAGIHLDPLLDEFTLAAPSYGWRGDDQLMVCPNMRAAQVHVRHRDSHVIRRVARSLVADRRVDQVIWRDDDTGKGGFRVLTADRGELWFRPSPASGAVTDARGAGWDYTGELAAVDAHVTDLHVVFGDYPSAFES